MIFDTGGVMFDIGMGLCLMGKETAVEVRQNENV
jgi:hypothetical protein